MDDLRWALLGLGLLFLVGLAWWELRRPRHAGRNDEDEAFTVDPEPGQRRVEPRFGDPDDTAAPGHDELPSMRAVQRGDDPPLVMLDAMSDGRGALNISIADDVAIDAPRSFRAAEPELELRPESEAEAEAEAQQPTGDEPAPADRREASARAPRRSPPVPRWPHEDRRRIISLRLVPRPPGRFGGRSLRLAFEACGLEHGAFDIFHLGDDAGDVIASAANLMRPGTFASATMDGQHFHGVHLFCVLPGPLPAGRAVDELIALARDLAQRLSGIVLDEVGQPLDEERAATVRAGAEQQAESAG
jgi:hypothetical protein